MKKVLDRLTTELTGLYGENMVAIYLYGSAASGDFHKGISNLNILCVLKEITAELLGQAHKTVGWFIKQGNPPPMFFSQNEIETSNDVFPVEFLDMQASHQLLQGKDILADVVIGRENHRLELEHELRSKYVGLRQNYLVLSHDAKALEGLLIRSLSSITTLFRHVLMLLGEAAPLQKRDIIHSISAKLNLDEACLLQILKLREGGSRLPAKDTVPVFERYLAQIDAVIKVVDGL